MTGVDGSKSMADIAAQNCRENSLSSSEAGPISIITGQIEQVPELGAAQVRAELKLLCILNARRV